MYVFVSVGCFGFCVLFCDKLNEMYFRSSSEMLQDLPLSTSSLSRVLVISVSTIGVAVFGSILIFVAIRMKLCRKRNHDHKEVCHL